MYKIVLDTNVLISAIVFGGKPRDVLELVIKGKLILAVSEAILEEVKTVLGGNKFQYPSQIVDSILDEIGGISELVKPKMKVDAIINDPDDNRILECAFESGADFIVSGDTDLLEMQDFKGTKIMNPADFLSKTSGTLS